LSVTFNEPLNVPTTVGLKVTGIVHMPVAARLPPQLLVSENGAVELMPVMERAVAPVLVNITFWEGGGQGLSGPLLNLQVNDRSAGISCALPLVRVIDELLDLV
jgi:hypothetical protein